MSDNQELQKNTDEIEKERQSSKRLRISSADSMDMSKSDIEDIIKKTLETAMETFKTEILARIEANQNAMTKRIEILERENFDLRKLNDEMTKNIKEVTQNNTETEERLYKLEDQTKSNAIKANENEQYSRRNNLRIFGLHQSDKNEDSISIVHAFITDKLKITNIKKEELAAAHRLGQSRQNAPPPMIVRFHTRDSRMTVLKNRKSLKGTPYVITEDLTKPNVNLLNRARTHPRIDSVWSWNWKCWALGKNGNKIRLSLFCDIDALLETTNM